MCFLKACRKLHIGKIRLKCMETGPEATNSANLADLNQFDRIY